ERRIIEGIRAKSVPRRYLLAILRAVEDLDGERALEVVDQARELCAEVGDGLTGRRRRIVGVFEPPLLQQRSDTPCPMLTWSSCFSQGRSPIRSPRCCATERAPYWPKR